MPGTLPNVAVKVATLPTQTVPFVAAKLLTVGAGTVTDTVALVTLAQPDALTPVTE